MEKDYTYYPTFHHANLFKLFVRNSDGKIFSKLKIWLKYKNQNEQLRLLTADDHELYHQMDKPGTVDGEIKNIAIYENYLKENHNN